MDFASYDANPPDVSDTPLICSRKEVKRGILYDKNTTTLAGIEPANHGIKIRCLNRLAKGL